MNKADLLSAFDDFRIGESGVGNWLNDDTPDVVVNRLCELDAKPLSQVQFNQLLILGHEAPMSFGCFEYYWLRNSDVHSYDYTEEQVIKTEWVNGSKCIVSLDHMICGFRKMYVDALLYFGNVRSAYRVFRNLSFDDLADFYSKKRINTDEVISRGPALDFDDISRDDRYLISEMACKCYESADGLVNPLRVAYEKHVSGGLGGRVSIKALIGIKDGADMDSRQKLFAFSVDSIIDDYIDSEADLNGKLEGIRVKFDAARKLALRNTKKYLSVANELDVYVATSMRTRNDFRDMAKACDAIFNNTLVKLYNLRYFNPTLSAASGHDDKGLIECLMVKCAKVLIYCAGTKDSYGKDAEAAMALSLGKPVIFYCNEADRAPFYRDVHPLSKLIEFSSGIVVGAIITDSISDTCMILGRIYGNKMQYELEKTKSGHLRLLEKLTKSVVRFQTSDELLSSTFWNHYHINRNL